MSRYIYINLTKFNIRFHSCAHLGNNNIVNTYRKGDFSIKVRKFICVTLSIFYVHILVCQQGEKKIVTK
ncbi:hypothetical protein BDA99DRAFT_500746 [Phascolomyces articulosus]|uniref:Uncharacterized protein n=1 Tax=Phascolomyces articulosus TaxID=60185 RepID=A0AAD5K6Y7_9FUNG|nr:hypothetical protein BDA99DRAFT_500746 [Phascolomyces articulosus]